jgi:hypothetical protein
VATNSGYLFAGVYRGGSSHWTTEMQYFYCCHPCREDGSTVMALQNCQQGQWERSFDSAGWSLCPDNTFITGFYKSSCNFIYCIEYGMKFLLFCRSSIEQFLIELTTKSKAQCCQIAGSKGKKGCGAKGSWGASLDSAGWSVLDGNQFLTGLYRSDCQWLYCIEYPMQCTFYSYD